ncbi:MAG: hypothetical protein LC104_06375, partial [Bacteroidales bacterium]|nr:hypothetical protein [Bacteroidales bacterium]
MWTPRRILLLLLGMAGFSAAYFVYSQFLGAVDGLPALPTAYLETEDGLQSFDIPEETYSPTLLRLQEAFGPGSPEVTDSIEYKTKLEIRDKGMVFACGQLMFAAEPSEYVTVAPFSVAFFGKPRPPGTRQPGEIAEINTFHADKAVLQFDRPVQNTQDLSGKARLVGMELVSTPDTPTLDPRRGRIEIINNQRSADAANHLVFRTPGPLYYRTANASEPKPPPGSPQIWSEAAIEVVDRRNLPRPLRGQNLNAVPSRSDDLRGRNAVANILLGLTLPPPTITAEGIKIFLTEQDANAHQDKRNASGYAGVERIELSERMQMNLWADGQSGLPGGPTDAPATPTPTVKLPEAAPGLIGGLADAAAIARILESKTLLVVETLGPFIYDFKTNTAVFEAAPAANPAVSNHVTVTRLSAKGGQDNLFCKRLEVEFNDPKDRPPAAHAGPTPSVNSGMKIKQLLATGEHVFVSVEGEQLLAQGKELRYMVDANAGRSTTILKGAPVVAVRERNRMQGGDTQTPAEVYLTSIDPKPTSGERKRTDIEVRGPGRIEMFDAASNDNTLQATWGTSLLHRKEITNGREQSLLTFNGGGTFLDTKGGMRLSADRLQLWLAEPGGDRGVPQGDVSSSSQTPKVLPQRLVAVGNVDGQSAEAIIRKTDQLTVTFRDVPPPAALAQATPSTMSQPASPAPSSPSPTTAPTETAAKPAATPPTVSTPPEKAKPPIYISARLVDAFVRRYPVPDTGRKGNTPDTVAGGPGLKYEMERARCEDRVMVHQDPADPHKSTRGTDIYGTKLLLDQSPSGGVLTVHGGTPTQPAQVYFEDMALFGPIVVLDQPNNAASVDGRGLLKMPSSSDLAGGQTDQASELEIQWSERMRFEGALSKAEFVGLVHAVQQPKNRERIVAATVGRTEPTSAVLATRAGNTDRRASPVSTNQPTWTRSRVICHRLDVTFDRPIYFNNLGPGVAKNGPAQERAQLRTAVCTPVPDDEVDRASGAGRMVTFHQETFFNDTTIDKSQRVTARQINVENDGREQQMVAAGPGEVRILQLGSKDQDAPGPTAPANRAKRQTDEQEMKLTIVRFPAQMIARDKGKIFQEASFKDGARVVQVPSENLNLDVEEHNLPERGVFLACTQVLDVSSARTKPSQPAKQWMTAVGNAEFQTDKYHGFGTKIVYDTDKVVLKGSDGSPAKLYKKIHGQVDRQDYHTGQEIIYNRNGTITGSGSIGGSVNT